MLTSTTSCGYSELTRQRLLIWADAGGLSQLMTDGAAHRISVADAERYGFDELDPPALAAMAVDNSQRGVPLAAFTDVVGVAGRGGGGVLVGVVAGRQ